MGRKKQEKAARKAAERDAAKRATASHGETPAGPLRPLARIAATLARQVDTPEGRQLLATGLTMAAAAASAALTRNGMVGASAAPAPPPPVPPVPPQTPVPPVSPIQPVPPLPPVPPVPPVPPHGTTTAPDPHAIGVALGRAAEDMLGRLFARKG